MYCYVDNGTLAHIIMIVAVAAVSFGNTIISLLGLRGYGGWTLVVYRGFLCPILTVPVCVVGGYSMFGAKEGGRPDLILAQSVLNGLAVLLGLLALDVRKNRRARARTRATARPPPIVLPRTPRSCARRTCCSPSRSCSSTRCRSSRASSRPFFSVSARAR